MSPKRQMKSAALSLIIPFVLVSLTAVKPAASYPQEAPQAAGVLDDTFGNRGTVVTRLLNGAGVGMGLAMQGDGRLLVAGYTINSEILNRSDFILLRYNADGSSDTDFGTSGKTLTDFFGLEDRANSVAIQSDGKILVAGTTKTGQSYKDYQFALARYESDGKLDSSFGSGGKVVLDFFGHIDEATDVKIEPDGKIVLAGYARSTDDNDNFALARYNIDGSLDTSFGKSGKVIVRFGEARSVAYSLAIQRDRKILVAGHTIPAQSPFWNFAMARLDTDGGLDVNFGEDGRVTTDFFGYYSAAYSVGTQRDGRIVLAGWAATQNTDKDRDIGVARYMPDGSLDSSFGTGGKLVTDFYGYPEVARSIAIQPDNKIVVSGSVLHSLSSETADVGVVRYNSDGSLDPTFGQQGKVTTDFGTRWDSASAMALQPDGKIVVAGAGFYGFNLADIELARYNPGPYFALSMNPSVTADRGTKIGISVDIIRAGGFTGNVTVMAPDTSGLKIRVSPDTVVASEKSATFNFKVKSSAKAGAQELAFIGKDDSGTTFRLPFTLMVK